MSAGLCPEITGSEIASRLWITVAAAAAALP